MISRALAPVTLGLALALAAAAPARGQQLPLPYGPNVGLDQAKALAAAAVAEARKHNWTIVVAIVDTGGHPGFPRGVGHPPVASVDVATRKAWAANGLKQPTKDFEDAAQGGRVVTLSLPGVVPIEGGLPIVVDGKIVGAIGISGATSAQDGQAAAAALAALK